MGEHPKEFARVSDFYIVLGVGLVRVVQGVLLAVVGDPYLLFGVYDVLVMLLRGVQVVVAGRQVLFLDYQVIPVDMQIVTYFVFLCGE